MPKKIAYLRLGMRPWEHLIFEGTDQSIESPDGSIGFCAVYAAFEEAADNGKYFVRMLVYSEEDKYSAVHEAWGGTP